MANLVSNDSDTKLEAFEAYRLSHEKSQSDIIQASKAVYDKIKQDIDSLVEKSLKKANTNIAEEVTKLIKSQLEEYSRSLLEEFTKRVSLLQATYESGINNITRMLRAMPKWDMKLVVPEESIRVEVSQPPPSVSVNIPKRGKVNKTFEYDMDGRPIRVTEVEETGDEPGPTENRSGNEFFS